MIHELDLRHEALKMLDSQPNGTLTTARLRKLLEEKLRRSTGPEDTKILKDRLDNALSQRVRNMISHRNASTGLEKRGLVTYCSWSHSMTITDAGRLLVRSLMS